MKWPIENPAQCVALSGFSTKPEFSRRERRRRLRGGLEARGLGLSSAAGEEEEEAAAQ